MQLTHDHDWREMPVQPSTFYGIGLPGRCTDKILRDKMPQTKTTPDKMPLQKWTAGQNATGEQTRYHDLLLVLVIVC